MFGCGLYLLALNFKGQPVELWFCGAAARRGVPAAAPGWPRYSSEIVKFTCVDCPPATFTFFVQVFGSL